MGRLLRALTAALGVSAGWAGAAAAGPAENELWSCTTEVVRRVPSWKAMRDARREMQQHGFRVVSKTVDSYDFRGRQVFSYGFQIGSDPKTYSVQCQDTWIQPGAAPEPQPERQRRRARQ
jgi:hypothetical protein